MWSMQADVKYFMLELGQNLRLFYLRVQDLISYPSCIIGDTSNPNCNRRIVLTILNFFLFFHFPSVSFLEENDLIITHLVPCLICFYSQES